MNNAKVNHEENLKDYTNLDSLMMWYLILLRHLENYDPGKLCILQIRLTNDQNNFNSYLYSINCLNIKMENKKPLTFYKF